MKKGLNKEEALVIIQRKCGFDENTMLYLQMYRYADSLLVRLAEQMKDEKKKLNL